MPDTIKGWMRGVIGNQVMISGEGRAGYRDGVVQRVTRVSIDDVWYLFKGDEFRVTNGYLITRWGKGDDPIVMLYYRKAPASGTG
jgi:hypothetical protein